MVNRMHGVVSLVLIAGGAFVGWITVLSADMVTGLLYGALILAGSGLIVYRYCTKCPIRTTACRHVFPGRLTIWLPDRPQTPYTLSDYLLVGLTLLVLVVFPLNWLREHMAAMVLFGLLILAGLVEIALFVCRGCGNTRCPVCRLRNRTTV